MVRFAWSQLRRRAGRALALLLGALAATTGFTVLTGATDTSRLVVREEVERNARGVYDILVRPQSGRSQFELDTHRVRPNFLSDGYGGITYDQWDRIRLLSGVDVAAPVAMLGYTTWAAQVPVDLTEAVDPAQTRQVLLLRPTWSADRGLTVAEDEPGFVYVTKRPVAWPMLEGTSAQAIGAWDGLYSDGVRRDPTATRSFCHTIFAPYEIMEDGAAVPICAEGAHLSNDWLRRTFRHVVELQPDGRFVVDGFVLREAAQGFDLEFEWVEPSSRLEIPVAVPIPLLLAAIDPEAEAALVGLDRAVVSGRYFDPAVARDGAADGLVIAPAVVAARPYLDEQLTLDVARLGDVPVAGRSLPELEELDALTGPTALTVAIDAAQAYVDVEGGLAQTPVEVPSYVIQAGATSYTTVEGGVLKMQSYEPAGAQDTWDASRNFDGRIPRTPRLADDVALRPMTAATLLLEDTTLSFQTVGVFDPEQVAARGGALTAPIDAYEPAAAQGGDDRSRSLLAGRNLLPSTNPGGYLAIPPSLMIDLSTFAEISRHPAPISAIRVRVGGIDQFDDAARELVRVVAEDIVRETGLAVDIVYGASAGPQTVVLPAGSFGRPELVLDELWLHKGVATVILQRVDQKSLVLFLLILVVSALFLANAVAAAVRDRRSELAVLTCMGWPARRVLMALLIEVGVIGVAAGVTSSVLAPVLGVLTGVDVSPARALVALPVAVALTLLAGAVPALRAARSDPAAAFRPAVRIGRRTRRPRGVAGLALIELVRVPGRTGLAALALAIGVAATTLLVAVTFAFHGTVVGSLLGDAVSLRARPVDLVAALGIVVLGVAATVDVLYLSIRERAQELAILRAIGWPDHKMFLLVAHQALGIGVLGAASGATAGLAAAAALTAELPATLVVSSLAVAGAAVLVALAAAVVPARMLQRQRPAMLLAE